MIRALRTLVFGVALAAIVIVIALLTAMYVISLAVRAALFGEPKASLAIRLVERVSQKGTVITDNTRHGG